MLLNHDSTRCNLHVNGQEPIFSKHWYMIENATYMYIEMSTFRMQHTVKVDTYVKMQHIADVDS